MSILHICFITFHKCKNSQESQNSKYANVLKTVMAKVAVAMAESSQLMPLINTGNYQGGTNDKPGPTI